MPIRLTILVFCLLSLPLRGTQFNVGPGEIFPTPNAIYLAEVVGNGDTINISGGPYTGRDALAVWQANDLLIRGVGDQPALFAGGEYIRGKGIWVCAGNRITVENMAFHDAAVPDRNGAGIRLDGNGLTVRKCLFRNNENGILTGNPGEGDIVIESSEFDGSGFGDGQSHNVYVGRVASLVFRYNYSHHANVGHCLKSRASVNVIEYNRIMDEEEGNASRLVDLPNGGQARVVGNLFMQGPNAPNNNMVGFGHEGYTPSVTSGIFVGNNTFVNQRPGSCLFVDIRPGAQDSYLVNNFIVGTGTLLEGEVAGQGGNVRSDPVNAGFADAGAYDYRITSVSPAVDAGVNSVTGTDQLDVPEHVYRHPLLFGPREGYGRLDAGAYEYEWPAGTAVAEDRAAVFFPNPTTGELHFINLRGAITEGRVVDAGGRVVLTFTTGDRLDIGGLPAGVYLVVLRLADNGMACRRVVKL